MTAVVFFLVHSDTHCHIHFPDSNRLPHGADKSDQVSITGPLAAVEQARRKIRVRSNCVLVVYMYGMSTSCLHIHLYMYTMYMYLTHIQFFYFTGPTAIISDTVAPFAWACWY